eukprot:COSAG05_NODE_12843_length_452_cov_0.753541_1_plen_116_part_10
MHRACTGARCADDPYACASDLQTQEYVYSCAATTCTAKSYDHSVYFLTEHRANNVAGHRGTSPFHALPNHTKHILGQMSQIDLAFRSMRTDLENQAGVLLYYGLEDYAPGESTDHP